MPINNKILHNSQSKMFRSPFGAVCTNSSVNLSIEIGSDYNVISVKLRLWKDKLGETLVDMNKGNATKDGFRYTCTITTPKHGGVLWYYFVMTTADQQIIFYGNNERNLGGIGAVYQAQPPSYQITVYHAGAKTPEWLKNAVMYQIFPDRFYNGNEDGKILASKKDCVLHSSWENKPYYFKDVDTKEIVAYDFFGGNLSGIKAKLAYLKDIGISVIYLNPIFQSLSNHRYDTGDYHKVDPMLGTNEDMAMLCEEAKKQGIRIILDGVFSHTGSDSKYFNRYGNYDSVGAYQSTSSPYYDWYDFTNYPEEYHSWWGFHSLPNVKETTKSYMDFIINNEDSVLKYWLKQGVSGWRMDVIDELPPEFSQRFYKVLKEVDPDAVMIGEVWEDASNKVSYGVPREYLCGQEMDSAMNYPLRTIILKFMLGSSNAQETNCAIMNLYENYPKENFYAMMNLVGSHDVERVLTLLGEAMNYAGVPAIEQARYRLSKQQYQLAVARLKIVSLWQMTFPGTPCVYYGDESGMQGFKDPHNRGPYIWGKEDVSLQSWYKKIIALRNQHQALKTGEFVPVIDLDDVYGYVRRIADGQDVFGKAANDETFLVIFNRSKDQTQKVSINVRGLCHGSLQAEIGDVPEVKVRAGKVEVELAPLQTILYRQVVEVKLDRGAGVLLHLTSLPSKYGIGDLGKGAYEFVNFLVQGGQCAWQILPLNPVGYGYSPYQSPSAFAGNPMLISLGKVVTDFLLAPRDAKAPNDLAIGKVDFAKVWNFKEKCLRFAYKKFSMHPVGNEYKDFCQKQSHWLGDYALFMALKKHFGDLSWNEWPEKVAKHEEDGLAKYRKVLVGEINYQKFLQYTFFKQWLALRHYANERGIKIIGDMPIFIAHDSADVWANQQLFCLDRQGNATKVAGVPPDYFSETGQLWGNPHYDWQKMKADDYQWWRNRFTTLLEMVDVIRVDHFRGFESYWEVDGKAQTAIEGKWVKGPGEAFFQTLEKYFGKLPIIAEDLGIITDAVSDLKDRFSFPGMKVLHFELLPAENGKAAFSCEQNCVVYTGTHDNNTTIGWYQDDLSDEELEAVGEALQVENASVVEACWELIRYAYASNASTAIIPMQDLLALDGKSRMNKPGTVGGDNWQWIAAQNAFSSELATKLAELCKQYKR